MNHSSADDAARAYWTAQMDQAFAFMETMRRYPICESGENLFSLIEAAKGIEVGFSSTKLNGRHPRVFFLRKGLIESFQDVARAMNERGWILKVEDAYRSPAMQRALSHTDSIFSSVLRKTVWELGGARPDAELMFRRLSAMIATRCRVGTHISGSAINISVFDRATGREIDRGGPYLEISEKTPMASPFVSAEAACNRRDIEELMKRHGWIAYPHEFWHFSSGDSYAEHLTCSGRPSRYGPVHFDGEEIRPIPDSESDALLEPLEFYREKIAGTLRNEPA